MKKGLRIVWVGLMLGIFLVAGHASAQMVGYQGIWKEEGPTPGHNFYIQHYLQGTSTVVVYTQDAETYFAFLSTISSNTFNTPSLDPGQARSIQIAFSSPITAVATITDNTQNPPASTTVNIVRVFQAEVTDHSGIWKDGTGLFNIYVQDYTENSTIIIYTFDAVHFEAFLSTLSGNTFSAINLGDGQENMTTVFSTANQATVNVTPVSMPSITPSANNFSYAMTKTFYPTPVPEASFSAAPRAGNAPLDVFFVDQSTGTVETYLWSFGDGGTSTFKNPDHSYAAAGTYDVSLTVSNLSGSASLTQAGFVTVAVAGTPPTANFSVAPGVGTAPLLVNFTDLSTGSPTSWSWNFGDSGDPNSVDSTAQNPSHTYTNTGMYTVKLTATNASGSNTLTSAGGVSVVSAPSGTLTADFNATTVTVGTAPLAVTFQDQSTGGVTSWAWNFGDAGDPNIVQSNSANPTHVFTVVGTYDVKLTVSDGSSTDSKSQSSYVTVNPGSSTATMGYRGF